MIEDYNGIAVLDGTGEKIGTVERSYVDDNGAVQIVAVKLGTLFAKHRLVPVDDAKLENNMLRIPYTKAMVEHAPNIDKEETLESEALERVRAYYAS